MGSWGSLLWTRKLDQCFLACQLYGPSFFFASFQVAVCGAWPPPSSFSKLHALQNDLLHLHLAISVCGVCAKALHNGIVTLSSRSVWNGTKLVGPLRVLSADQARRVSMETYLDVCLWRDELEHSAPRRRRRRRRQIQPLPSKIRPVCAALPHERSFQITPRISCGHLIVSGQMSRA